MPPGFRHLFILLAGLCFAIPATGQTDFTVDGTHVIPLDSAETYNNLYLDSNDDSLRVEGTLIVNGNLEMNGNKSRFSMGENAFVLVYGDFLASNQVDVSVSSYLIIQGSFIRESQSEKENLNIDNGNIYIFGDVDGWPGDFQSCDTYDGTTEDRVNETCDFGTEESLEDNIESFPPEYVEKLNCYDLNGPVDTSACPGSTATFSTNSIPDVIYKWQYRTDASQDYVTLADTTNQITVTDITADMAGYQYRVIVRPDPGSSTTSNCKISISDPATLSIQQDFIWTGATNTNWIDPSNWICNQTPGISSDVIIPAGLSNYPVLNSGELGQANNLELESGASISLLDGSLEIAGIINSSGDIDAADGTLIFSGSSSQSIPSGLFINNKVKNLEIDNSSEVISNTQIDLSGWLKVSKGNFETNDMFSLISDSNQTALIDSSGGGNILGDVSMQRYIAPATGYKYFSSPFTNSIVGDFSAYIDLNSNFPRFYRYDENREDNNGNDATGWQAYTTSSSPLNPMEGYAANFGAGTSAVTINLSGQVNSGALQVNLSNNNGTYTNGFHLVGNPYPSPIDWDSSTGWTKSNIADAIYFFNATDEFTGTYSSYVNGVASTGSETSIIPSMQGFFVQVNSGAASGNLGMTNEVRTNNFSQSFYKSQERKGSNKSLIRLSAGFSDSEVIDAMAIYFDFTANEGFEPEMDALKLMNTNTNVPNIYYPLTENRNLSINAVPKSQLLSEKLIPLGLELKRDGNVRISLRDIENLDSGTRIFLIDKKLKLSIELNKEDYSFSARKGIYDDRFFLSFLPVDFENDGSLFENCISAVSNNRRINVRMDFLKPQNGILEIRSIDGKLISSKEVSSNEETWFEGIASSGVYLVSFRSPEETITKKVIVK